MKVLQKVNLLAVCINPNLRKDIVWIPTNYSHARELGIPVYDVKRIKIESWKLKMNLETMARAAGI